MLLLGVIWIPCGSECYWRWCILPATDSCCYVTGLPYTHSMLPTRPRTSILVHRQSPTSPPLLPWPLMSYRSSRKTLFCYNHLFYHWVVPNLALPLVVCINVTTSFIFFSVSTLLLLPWFASQSNYLAIRLLGSISCVRSDAESTVADNILKITKHDSDFRGGRHYWIWWRFSPRMVGLAAPKL